MANALKCGMLRESHGIIVEVPSAVIDDPTGDELDAVLCLIQAAWSWQARERRYGAPEDLDKLEGWIADPSVC